MKLILLMSLALVSCGKQSSGKLYRVEESALVKFVNQKNMPADPNLTLDRSIVNDSYPIEIALYKDGQFYYNLPNLGDGKGTWKNSNGRIELKAKRSLFDMYIEVFGTDQAAETLKIQFSDRWGPKTLKMTNVNL